MQFTVSVLILFLIFRNFWDLLDIYYKTLINGSNYITGWIRLYNIPTRQTYTNSKRQTMKDYFETNEKNDLQMLYEFNYDKHLFDSIKPTREKSQYDATATHKSRTFSIELKHRLCKKDKYQTMFIEDYKLAALYLEYILHGKEPLYICILDDAILIFNLLHLKHEPKLRILDIESKGYDKVQQQERRYLLDIRDAVIYNLNNTGDEECKTKTFS